MKITGKCPKCGSTDITTDAQVIEHYLNADQQLRVASFANPDALLFKGKATSLLSACVCFACGFTELYAASPLNLRQS